MNLRLRRLKCKFDYYKGKIYNFFGFCPCGAKINRTRNGQTICTSCKKRR